MSETVIRSRYSERIKFTVPSGSEMANDYQIRIDENGHKKLFKTGEHNQYNEIQKYADEVDIGLILKRYEAGETEVLERIKAQYADLTKAPKSLKEAQDKIIQIKSEFYQLPIEKRKEFDNSPEKYVQEYGNKRWQNVMFKELYEKEVKQISVEQEEKNKAAEKKGEVNE